MAAKWEKIERDGDRYNLRYRTAGDGRVRPEHAALNGVTLPPSDPFWASCYPPNGWRCRCNVVRVLKDKYPETDHDDALRRADEALSSDKKGIFRFNSGQKRKTFPDYNPYTIRRCNDCDIARGKASFAFVPENDLCSACQFLHAQKNEENGASERIKKYDDAKWERTHISSNNNGFVVTQKERIAEAVNKQEIEKYEKEKRMCINLANNGHDIEFLRGNNRPVGQTYDILMDGMKADLKCVTGGAGNIVKYAKKALTKQGGVAVIFELPNGNKEMFEALAEARRKLSGHIYFYGSVEN